MCNLRGMFSDGGPIAQLPLKDIPRRYPFVLFLPPWQTEALPSAEMERVGGKAERGVAAARKTARAQRVIE